MIIPQLLRNIEVISKVMTRCAYLEASLQCPNAIFAHPLTFNRFTRLPSSEFALTANNLLSHAFHAQKLRLHLTIYSLHAFQTQFLRFRTLFH